MWGLASQSQVNYGQFEAKSPKIPVFILTTSQGLTPMLGKARIGISPRERIPDAAGRRTISAMYDDVQQASQLNAAFTAIAQNLANLAIAK